MRRCRYITLFVPEELRSNGGIWKRYLISHASVHLRREEGARKGEIYLFFRDSAAYSGSARCVMPEIFPGCAVLTRGDLSDGSESCALPDGCLRVLSAESFGGGRCGHVKLTVG